LKITDVTSDMRIEQLKSAMDYALRKFEVQIGLSAGTFSYDESGLKTATEVVSDNSMTYQTRSSYLTMVEKAIKELCTSILELADYNGLFKYDVAKNDPEFSIYFDDGLFVDKDKQLDEDLKATAAMAMPKKQFLIRNYGLSDDEAEEWYQETLKEQRDQQTNIAEETRGPDGDDDVGAD
jgi:phage portal protein, SPP1 gp6-like